jgi:hypothetical protein
MVHDKKYVYIITYSDTGDVFGIDCILASFDAAKKRFDAVKGSREYMYELGAYDTETGESVAAVCRECGEIFATDEWGKLPENSRYSGLLGIHKHMVERHGFKTPEK